MEGEHTKTLGLTERAWQIIGVASCLLFLAGTTLAHYDYTVNRKYGKRGLHCYRLVEAKQQACLNRVVRSYYGKRPMEAAK